MSGTGAGHLVSVEIDPASLATTDGPVEAERRSAIRDLLADNRFAPGGADGAFGLRLSVAENRLVLDVTSPDGAPVVRHILSLTPLKRVVKDYFLVCESYYAAIRTATPDQIEAIDVSRRTLHDDGARVVLQRLAGKIDLDFATARRLFTLVCALRWRG